MRCSVMLPPYKIRTHAKPACCMRPLNVPWSTLAASRTHLLQHRCTPRRVCAQFRAVAAIVLKQVALHLNVLRRQGEHVALHVCAGWERGAGRHGGKSFSWWW